jgi:hypothetical protein
MLPLSFEAITPGEILILIIGQLVIAVFTSTIAHAKGYDSTSWLLGGVFFGPIALAVSFGLPDKLLHKYLRLIAEQVGAKIEIEPPDKVDA